MPSDVENLTEEIYRELRCRAATLCDEGGPVAPTSLVHEAFERLYHADPDRWADSVHFKATATLAMRQILLDRVKASKRLKRGGPDLQRVSLSGIAAASTMDVVELSEALDHLAAQRPRTALVVEYRLLGGMDVAETSDAMGISASTVKREWRTGRAYLLAWLQG